MAGSWVYFKVEPTGLPDALDMELRGGNKNDCRVVGLNWRKDSFALEAKTVGSTGLGGKARKKFSLGPGRLEVLIRYPRRDVKLVVQDVSLQGRKTGWRYRFGRHQHTFGI